MIKNLRPNPSRPGDLDFTRSSVMYAYSAVSSSIYMQSEKGQIHLYEARHTGGGLFLKEVTGLLARERFQNCLLKPPRANV